MATYAYIRVSTQIQTLENQKYEIKKWSKSSGTGIDSWIEETISGTITWEKRVLGKTVRKMQAGDMLVCTEISRLGRNMLMIMTILNACSQKGISIHTIKDNFDLSDSINSKIIAFAFALASEIERNLISQRTKEALAAKKMAGMKLGRPNGSTGKVLRLQTDRDKILKLLTSGKSIKAVAKMYHVHRNTLSKSLKMVNLPK